jgi:hypothetical protein
VSKIFIIIGAAGMAPVLKIEPRPLGSGCLLMHSGSVFILCGASRHVTYYEKAVE